MKQPKFWLYFAILALIILGIYIITLKVYGFRLFGTSFGNVPEKHYYFSQFFYAFSGVILSFISILLIYVTFQQQIVQNRRFKYFSLMQYLGTELSDIIKDINDITYKSYKGIDALYNFDRYHRNHPNTVFNSLNYILVRFQGHIDIIENIGEKIVTIETKRLLKERAYLMLNTKIIWPVMEKIFNNASFIKHKDKSRDRLIKVIADTYKFLLPLGDVSIPTQSSSIMKILADYKIVPPKV